MSLYPSLEDMTVGKMAQAQAATQPRPAVTQGPAQATPSAPSAPTYGGLYPNLDDEYMGLNLVQYRTTTTSSSHAVVPSAGTAVATKSNSGPVSGLANVGIRRAEIKQGVREVVVCKDAKGKVGVSLFAESKGVFVCYVKTGSPGAIAGLRFGDQILQINGEVVAGYSSDKASKVIKKAPGERISLGVRDRPFERTITMQKNSDNTVGFSYNSSGEIKAIVKDSSAARNGLLIDHYLCEVNGQNVIGIKDKEIAKIFADSPRTATITIMPKFIYDHLMKNMGSSLRKSMDHSIPDV